MKEKPENRRRSRRARIPVMVALIVAAMVLTVYIAVAVDGSAHTGVYYPRPPFQQEPGNMPDDTEPEQKVQPPDVPIAPAAHGGQGFRPDAMPQ